MVPDVDVGEVSLASYVQAFAPAVEWDELARWPPDVFALTNLVVDHTESYRFVVSPPPGKRWPPLPDWTERVRAAAQEWRDTATPPELVGSCWEVVSRSRDVSLDRIRSGDASELVVALLTLHAVADEACAGIGSAAPQDRFEARARALLQATGSLARLSPTRVRIVPKGHFSARGITARSLSRYVALCYELVDVRWRGLGAVDQQQYNVLLLPWPLAVHARDFRPAPPELLDNMDPKLFGFFEFAPDRPLDFALLEGVLGAAGERGAVDTVVLPEVAVEEHELPRLERILERFGVTVLVTGVRRAATAAAFGRNYLYFAVRTPDGWTRYEQDKHHRWCLEDEQLRQYHLTRALHPAKRWWEAIDIRERTLHVVDVGGGVTAAPLVCEDLSRLDEVAEIVRRIGPGLVLALLLDGPQLATRWPARYASIIADDPGSSVLTLTSLGMAARSRPEGIGRSRVIAQWNSRADGLHELELARGAAGMLLTISVEPSTHWTADGRRHADVPRMRLSKVRQLRVRRTASPTSA